MNKYHIFILVLYVALLGIVVNFYPDLLNYSFSLSYIPVIFLLLLSALIGFYFLNRVFKFKKLSLRGPFTPVYILAFAVPEEIIFRGIIQGYLETKIQNIICVVLISSLIFALAHLPNDAKISKPKTWNWQLFILTLTAGILLGAAYALTGSLLPPTILHALLLAYIIYR